MKGLSGYRGFLYSFKWKFQVKVAAEWLHTKYFYITQKRKLYKEIMPTFGKLKYPDREHDPKLMLTPKTNEQQGQILV